MCVLRSDHKTDSRSHRLTQLSALVVTILLLGFNTAGAQGEASTEEVPPEGVESTDTTEDSAEEETAQESTAEPAWYERIRFSGDFRSRYEGFYQSDRETRNRVRLRLRLRLDTDINDDARFQVQIASGDPGTPVSTNQTFTSFFRPKPFNLDRAYLAYNPKAASAMTLGLGKFSFPQTRTQMVFDDDLNFEGGWEQVSWSPASGVGVNLVALQTVVNELSSDADSYMLAGYGEVSFDIGAHTLQVSAANYGWGNPDQIAVGRSVGPLNSILTNEALRDIDGNITGFASEFNVVDVITEATFQTGRPDYPLRFLADYAHNTKAVNDRDSGFWVEAEYGQPRNANTWGATYTYGWVEQDATPSAFVFSDMPGTNLRLHMIESSYVPKKGLSLDLTLHVTKQLVVPATEANNWLSRLHVAVVARF